ncbi:MAG: DEAD/DEAH box helicase family protein [Anaerolineales bacterium]
MEETKAFKPSTAKKVTPRNWQNQFVEEVLKKYQTGERDFLCEAVPAGGKTFGALLAANMMFEQGIIEQLIVVAPTDYLRDQWVRKAWSMAGFSLKPFEIDTRTGMPVLNDDYCGVVTTFAQVASGSNADVLLGLGRRKPTLVIFDEVHHCGEDKTWGAGIQNAFWARGGDKVFYRLSISGTPFRSDNERIPFVDYERTYVTKDDGTIEVQWVSRPDFRYRYIDALMDDEIVREVTFRMETGKFSWKSNVGEFSGKQFTDVDFNDELDEYLWNERYKTAVNPQNEATGDPSKFVVELLAKANEELTRYRTKQLHPSAGGLVLVEGKEAAELVGDILFRITGEKAVVVHNSVADARTLIENFENEDKRWIVSIRMVSEGVDIPRLRVAVYLSDFKTQLFFLQFIGRVTRWMKDLPIADADGIPLGQSATVFIPADPELVKYARDLQNEIIAYIRRKMERLGVAGTGGTRLPSEYEWINATEAQDHAEGHHAAAGYAEAQPDEFSEIDQFKNRFQILRHASRGSVKGIMQYARQGHAPAPIDGDTGVSVNPDMGEATHLNAVKAMVEQDFHNIQDGWGSAQSKAPAKRNLDLRSSASKMVPRLAAKLVKAEIMRGGGYLSPRFKSDLGRKGIRLEIDENNRLSQKLTGHMAMMLNAALKKIQRTDAKHANNDQIEERRRLLADWEAEVVSGNVPHIPDVTF